MQRPISRREFASELATLASAAALLPLQSSCRSLSQQADVSARLGNDLKDLRGRLSFDQASRQAAADDFGHLVHRTPLAVLKPASVDDIVEVVRAANRHGVKVAMNGNSHSCFGHAQTRGGIVIQSGALKTIHRIDADSAEVDAGVTWGELAKATLAKGLTPPVMAEVQDLSIGGTLSLGGIGGTSHRSGAQVDHALELEAVTGTGERVRCSMERERELFESLLAGFGQSALITRAKIRLVPAPTHVMLRTLVYRDLSAYLAVASRTAADGRFDHQLGRVAFGADGRPSFWLEAGRFYSEPAKPDLDSGVAGLQFAEAMEPVVHRYAAYLNPAPGVGQATEGLQVPHATLYLFVPLAQTESFVTGVLEDRSASAGARLPTLFGLYALNARRFTRPLFQVPQKGEQFFAMYLLRAAPVEDRDAVENMVKKNRMLYEKTLAAGAKVYPVSALPMSAADWHSHFGDHWELLAAAKKRFDPNHALNPGPGLFGVPGA